MKNWIILGLISIIGLMGMIYLPIIASVVFLIVSVLLLFKEIYPLFKKNTGDDSQDSESDDLEKIKPWICIGVYLTIIVGVFWFLWYTSSGSAPYTKISAFGIKIKASRVWDAFFIPPVVAVIFGLYSICKEEKVKLWLFLVGVSIITACFLWWGSSLIVFMGTLLLASSLLILMIGGILYSFGVRIDEEEEES